MIKISFIITLTFVLILAHIPLTFAEPVACAVSTDPCGEGSGSTCDINNICPDSKKTNNTNSYNNNNHLSNTSINERIIPKHSSSEVKGNVSMPAFLEVFELPKD